MNLILLALFVWLVGGAACLVSGRRAAMTRVLGPGSAFVGCLTALWPVIKILISRKPLVLSFAHSWQMPFGALRKELDPISAFFAIPILLVCAMASVYGAEYLRHYEVKKNTGLSWFFYNILTSSMMVVVLARNGMLFLMAWEIMSLSSFFLVKFEGEKDEVRRAGWVYLVATHIGTAFLLVMFAILGHAAGSMDFADYRNAPIMAGLSGLAFVLAVIGFGTKAGFVPLHVWLPEAHPAAPSHVSAVMSGVMIKTGIYGLVRVITFFPDVPHWWGWLLVCIGGISGILGVLFALAQHDLKRLLAYSSVENIGVIALGLGVGLLGISYGNEFMTLAGFAGAFLHVLNHAIFKSLLFMGAGAVFQATGTRDIDHLGGVLKRLPLTGTIFLIGSAAISGLPPLNGFLSEFLIYLGAFKGITAASGSVATFSFAVIGSLALIGGLAAACFTRVFGIVFLGEPRTGRADGAKEVGMLMVWPMALLAFLCAAISLCITFFMPSVIAVAGQIGGVEITRATQANVAFPVVIVSLVAGAFVFLIAIAAILRRLMLHDKPVGATVTWGCGYAAPTTRMQYSSSSFAEPLTRFFNVILLTRRNSIPPRGLFPANASFSSETPDISGEKVYAPIFEAVESVLSRFRWMQHGRLNLYILYIALTLLTLLIWKLR